MRKVRNPQIHTTNPGLLFARGVEQLVSDGLYRPARKDAQDTRREPPSTERETAAVKGNFFSVFLRQFVF